jgi:organic radical activating enzyme
MTEQVMHFTKQEPNLMRIDHQRKENRNLFVVNWCLGNTCNFECSYCPENLHNGTIPWPDINVVKGFVKRVRGCYPDKELFFEFTGGEVTMYRHFEELLKYCTELGIRVGCISNGSRTIRWWDENKHLIDHVCLSYHPEQGDMEHFYKVAELMAPVATTHLNVMMPPDENFDKCLEFANTLTLIDDVTMALQPLIVNLKDVLYDYTDEQKKVFANQWEITGRSKKTRPQKLYRGTLIRTYKDGRSFPTSAHRFIAEQTNNWQGFYCLAGVEQIIVDMEGDVYRGWCFQGGKIGNIQDETFTFPSEFIRCTSTMCHCNFDIMCTKFR